MAGVVNKSTFKHAPSSVFKKRTQRQAAEQHRLRLASFSFAQQRAPLKLGSETENWSSRFVARLT